MGKQINPYQRLKNVFRETWNKVQYAHKVQMWNYPKNRLSEGWNLTDLYERVGAATQLGYDVILEHNSTGLTVFYRKKIPSRPFEIS